MVRCQGGSRLPRHPTGPTSGARREQSARCPGTDRAPPVPTSSRTPSVHTAWQPCRARGGYLGAGNRLVLSCRTWSFRPAQGGSRPACRPKARAGQTPKSRVCCAQHQPVCHRRNTYADDVPARQDVLCERLKRGLAVPCLFGQSLARRAAVCSGALARRNEPGRSWRRTSRMTTARWLVRRRHAEVKRTRRPRRAGGGACGLTQRREPCRRGCLEPFA